MTFATVRLIRGVRLVQVNLTVVAECWRKLSQEPTNSQQLSSSFGPGFKFALPRLDSSIYIIILKVFLANKRGYTRSQQTEPNKERDVSVNNLLLINTHIQFLQPRTTCCINTTRYQKRFYFGSSGNRSSWRRKHVWRNKITSGEKNHFIWIKHY